MRLSMTTVDAERLRTFAEAQKLARAPSLAKTTSRSLRIVVLVLQAVFHGGARL
jgi:hypothetical protein